MSNINFIGIDHGYKNMKGANCMFPTKLKKLGAKPYDMDGVIEFEGEYYTIYGNPLPAVNNTDKSVNREYYILTLAVLGKEFEYRGILPGPNKIHVRIGAGVPHMWYDTQRDDFAKMLMQNSEINFGFNGKHYNVVIDNVSVFMQGYSALPVIAEIPDKNGYVALVDIGGGTVDTIVCNEFHTNSDECFLDTKATIFLLKEIDSKLQASFGNTIPEADVIKFICSANKNTTPANKYQDVIKEILITYSDNLFTYLRERGINTDYATLCFMGGGAKIIKSFGTYGDNVIFCDDMHINAKGYEFLERSRAIVESRK